MLFLVNNSKLHSRQLVESLHNLEAQCFEQPWSLNQIHQSIALKSTIVCLLKSYNQKLNAKPCDSTSLKKPQINYYVQTELFEQRTQQSLKTPPTKNEINLDSSFTHSSIIPNGCDIDGYAILNLSTIDNLVELYRIGITPAARSEGLGFNLLSSSLHFSKAICHKLYKQNQLRSVLEVNESNDPAITLYKKVGYKIIHQRKKYYGLHDALIMECLL